MRQALRPKGPGRSVWQKRQHNGHKAYAPYGYATTIRKFGHLLTWNEMTWKERHRTMLRIKGGRNRGRFWKTQGFENCKRATAARLKYNEERIARGEISPQRKARLRRVAAGEIKPPHPSDVRSARIFMEGERAREVEAMHDGSRPLLGPLLVAGHYDPEYLMRREMRILDVMSRCPA